MEKLISCKSEMKFVPESYMLPRETRPGKLVFPLLDVPTIDLENGNRERSNMVHQITKASQDYGFFQLINHGVSEKLMSQVLEVANEFFEQPANEKAKFYSDDLKQSCRMYTSLDYDREKVHYWRDILLHPGHPVEEHLQFWPQYPTQYREIVGSYSGEVRKISMWLLDIICEGLGLESGYFDDKLSQKHLIGINHYPTCPDPSLTLGLPKHCDINLITLVIQGNEPGFQVFKDEQWFDVKPLPHSFLVNIGYSLQLISNGKLKGAEHRVVTNKNMARTTVVSSIHPSSTSNIGPTKELVSKCNPQLYKDVIYKDFVGTCKIDYRDGEPPLDRYKIQV